MAFLYRIPLQEVNEQMMMDNTVSGRTHHTYISDSSAFFCWRVEHKAGWLTAYSQQKKVILFEMEAGGMGTREGKNHVTNRFVESIQHAAGRGSPHHALCNHSSRIYGISPEPPAIFNQLYSTYSGFIMAQASQSN